MIVLKRIQIFKMNVKSIDINLLENLKLEKQKLNDLIDHRIKGIPANI